MATETLSKDALRAVQHFEDKLQFEWGPFSLNKQLQDKQPVQVIDLRTPELYAKAHIPGAQNILYEDLEKHLSKLSKEIPTVVYCYDLLCSLATRAALLLAKNGFNVKELVGGFDEWKAKDFPLEDKASQSASSCSTTKGSSCC